MTVVAVICEYNLFHSGHGRLICAIKEKYGGECAVLSLMSGSFTQRGDFAACDKYMRAKAALLGGSDVTLELPLPYCSSVGEVFARGAVGILNALSCVDVLAFGSECGDISLLCDMAKNQLSPAFEEAMKAAIERGNGGESYIVIRERVYEALFGKRTLHPNDTLALEYIMALMRTKSRIVPFTVKREGEESATKAREKFLSGDFDSLSLIVPPSALELYRCAEPYSAEYASRAMLYALRCADPDRINGCFGADGGLGARIAALSRECDSISSLYAACVTKTYTEARIKRCVLSILLGITGDDVHTLPERILMLSANEKGRQVISRARGGGITVTTRGAKTYGRLERCADALYTLGAKNAGKCEKILTQNPYIEK